MKKAVCRAAYLLYLPYKWLFFFPVVALSTLFFGTLAVVLAIVVNPRFSSWVCGKGWARLNSWLTPMLVNVSGRQHVDTSQSYVIVSNHQSHYDVFVLYGWLDVDFKWVMKQELRKIPALGFACAVLGHIYIDRSNHQAAIASINAAKERIVNGTSVLFFPEGTRSRDGELAPFKRGAFRMALDLELPILPITVSGTGRILPPDTRRVAPGCARLQIHAPIPVSGVQERELPQLMEQVRQVILSGMTEPAKAS